VSALVSKSTQSVELFVLRFGDKPANPRKSKVRIKAEFARFQKLIKLSGQFPSWALRILAARTIPQKNTPVQIIQHVLHGCG
jgi:hypothetical protein